VSINFAISSTEILLLMPCFVLMISLIRGQIRPYVSDTRNLLLLRIAAEEPDEDFLATLSYSLRRPIQVEYQIEEQEIAVERIGRDQQRRIILWEAAEGGIGVWERLIEEPGAVSKLARTALGLLHFDEITGNEVPGLNERCPAACYDCLLSYAISSYPYPAKAGCPTIGGRRRTRAAPTGTAPALSWS